MHLQYALLILLLFLNTGYSTQHQLKPGSSYLNEAVFIFGLYPGEDHILCLGVVHHVDNIVRLVHSGVLHVYDVNSTPEGATKHVHIHMLLTGCIC